MTMPPKKNKALVFGLIGGVIAVAIAVIVMVILFVMSPSITTNLPQGTNNTTTTTPQQQAEKRTAARKCDPVCMCRECWKKSDG